MTWNYTNETIVILIANTTNEGYKICNRVIAENNFKLIICKQIIWANFVLL